jgi:hypothetical protein
MPEDLINIPLLGMSIYCADNQIFNLIPTDYDPHFGLGGIILQQTSIGDDPRPAHIDENNWEFIKDKKIVEYEIFENTYQIGGEKIVIPFGIKLEFENKMMLYVLNIGIESYSESEHKYEFARGGEDLTIFFDDKIIKEYGILSDSITKL